MINYTNNTFNAEPIPMMFRHTVMGVFMLITLLGLFQVADAASEPEPPLAIRIKDHMGARCSVCNREADHSVARLRGDAPRGAEANPCLKCHNERYVFQYGDVNGLYVKVHRKTVAGLLAEVNLGGCGGNFEPKLDITGPNGPGVDYCYMSLRNEANSQIKDFGTKAKGSDGEWYAVELIEANEEECEVKFLEGKDEGFQYTVPASDFRQKLNPFPHYYVYPMKKGQFGVELNNYTQPIQAGSNIKWHLFATSEWGQADENFTGERQGALHNRMTRTYPHAITGKRDVKCLSDAKLSLEELTAFKRICEDDTSMVSQMEAGDRQALHSSIQEMLAPKAIHITGYEPNSMTGLYQYGNPNGLYVKVPRTTLAGLLKKVVRCFSFNACGGNWKPQLPLNVRGGVTYCYMSLKNENESNSNIIDFESFNPFPHYYIFPMKKGQNGIEFNGNTKPIEAGSDIKWQLFASSEWGHKRDPTYTGARRGAFHNRMTTQFPHTLPSKWTVRCLSDANISPQDTTTLRNALTCNRPECGFTRPNVTIVTCPKCHGTEWVPTMVNQMEDGDRAALNSMVDRADTRIERRRRLAHGF